MQWIKVIEGKPKFIEGKDYSENVLAVLEGNLSVMAYCYHHDGIEGGCFWANCYNDIHGDPEWDDDYQPTHWMPLPHLP